MNGETCIPLGGGVALAAMFSSNLMHQATICALPQIASRLGHPEFQASAKRRGSNRTPFNSQE
jgi:hypothetical protein